MKQLKPKSYWLSEKKSEDQQEEEQPIKHMISDPSLQCEEVTDPVQNAERVSKIINNLYAQQIQQYRHDRAREQQEAITEENLKQIHNYYGNHSSAIGSNSQGFDMEPAPVFASHDIRYTAPDIRYTATVNNAKSFNSEGVPVNTEIEPFDTEIEPYSHIYSKKQVKAKKNLEDMYIKNCSDCPFLRCVSLDDKQKVVSCSLNIEQEFIIDNENYPQEAITNLDCNCKLNKTCIIQIRKE